MPVTAARPRAAGSRRYAALLPDRFDVVHLGLGDDGHTASWPPGDPVIDDRRAVALSGEYNGRVRMTLTVPVVNAARHRLVLATGAAKAAIVERWLLHDHALADRSGAVAPTPSWCSMPRAAARLPLPRLDVRAE